jgi:hypothetical protein
MMIQKGDIYHDTSDDRLLIVTHVHAYERGQVGYGHQVIEFLEVEPLGHFCQYRDDELAENGIIQGLP